MLYKTDLMYEFLTKISIDHLIIYHIVFKDINKINHFKLSLKHQNHNKYLRITRF